MQRQLWKNIVRNRYVYIVLQLQLAFCVWNNADAAPVENEFEYLRHNV